jgi:hypothetical protein
MSVTAALVCSTCGKSHASQLMTRVARKNLCEACYDQWLDLELGLAADVAPGEIPQPSTLLEDARPITAQATLAGQPEVLVPLLTLSAGRKTLLSLSAGR